MKSCRYFLVLTLLTLLVSCNQGGEDWGNFKKSIVSVDLNAVTYLGPTEYNITNIIPLKFPESVLAVKDSQVRYVGSRIYILDSDYNKTVFVFDSKGNFLHKLGTVGHAKNEYIEKPTSIAVDKDANVHVYERASVRVIVFDKNGKFLKTVNFRPSVPGSVEVLDNGNYVCSFEYKNMAEDDSQLAIYDKDGKFLKCLMRHQKETNLPQFGPNIFKDRELVFAPILSDSVIILSSDSIKEIMKIQFKGKQNSQEIIDESLSKGTYLPLYDLKDGVQFIDNVEITDSLIHISYAYNLVRCHFVKNITSGKSYNNLEGCFYDGITPQSEFTIKNDKLLYFITQEDIDLVKTNMENDPQQWEESRKHTSPLMLDLIDNKIPLPVLVSIKLK